MPVVIGPGRTAYAVSVSVSVSVTGIVDTAKCVINYRKARIRKVSPSNELARKMSNIMELEILILYDQASLPPIRRRAYTSNTTMRVQ